MTHDIFAIELCLGLEPRSRLRAELRDLIQEHPRTSTPGLKWKLLQKVSRRLVENQHLFVKGCWDFFDDDGRALRDYDMWSNGMITEEGARKEPSGVPMADQPRFMTFTISLLIKDGTPCARELGDLCDIPEEDLWKRETFVKILRGLDRVNFASVKSDVIYLIPRDEDWGLTEEDLKDEKFHYFRPITH